MAILEDQNITTNPALAGNSEWQKNLGLNHTEGVGDPEYQPTNGKHSGFSYGPPGLPAIRRTALIDIEGPRGIRILDGSTAPGSYGPDVENRLPSVADVGEEYVGSLLGGFAHMLGRTGDAGESWGSNGSAARLQQTMTSGSQLASLRDATLGVDNVPVSSGGPWYGYQFGTEYGISNLNAASENIIASLQANADAGSENGTTIADYLKNKREGTRAETGEIQPPEDDIELTGLRSVPGMKTVLN